MDGWVAGFLSLWVCLFSCLPPLSPPLASCRYGSIIITSFSFCQKRKSQGLISINLVQGMPYALAIG